MYSRGEVKTVVAEGSARAADRKFFSALLTHWVTLVYPSHNAKSLALPILNRMYFRTGRSLTSRIQFVKIENTKLFYSITIFFTKRFSPSISSTKYTPFAVCSSVIVLDDSELKFVSSFLYIICDS